MIRKLSSHLTDAVTCFLMNSAQRATRGDVCTPAELESYLSQGEKTTREEFFAVTPMVNPKIKEPFLRWRSPLRPRYTMWELT